MKTYLIAGFLMLSGAAFAAEKPAVTHSTLPMITVIALYNGHGIPPGWIDSTTRIDATEVCNQLIASQSKFYSNAISHSRCIIQVHEED